MKTLQGDAAVRYTENGQDFYHYFGVRPQRGTSTPRERVYSHESADMKTIRRVTVGSGPVYDATFQVRHEGQLSTLEDFIAAGRRGATIEYFPSLSQPSRSYPCVLMSASDIVTDTETWFQPRFQSTVVLRRIDGGRWVDAFQPALFYYRAGNELPGATFARSGAIGSYVDESGVLQNEGAANIRRVSFVDDDGDGVLDTLEELIEDAATNEFTQSEDLTHADWAATGLSARTADQALGPENALALDELVEDSGNSTHRATQTVTMTADASYALSAWMMANTRDYGVLWFGENGALGTNYVRGFFNLTDGTVEGTAEAGTGSHIRSYVEDWTWLVPGLYRCVVVGSVGNSATSIDAAAAMSSNGSNLSYTGDGSSSIYVGYLQIEDENSGAASSYIPTTTAAASRGAESLTADIGFVPQDLTLYSEWRELGTSLASQFPSVIRLGASATDFFISIRRDNSSGDGRYEVAVQKDSVQLGVVEPNLTVSYGDVVRCAASVSYNAATDEITLTVEIEVVGGSSATGTSTFSGSYGPEFTSNQVEIGTDGFAGHRAHKVFPGVENLAWMVAA